MLLKWAPPLFLAAVVLASASALAGKANVTGVSIQKESGDSYRFDVTIRSDDKGWDKYADKWEVVGPDGAVLGTRTLLHPHDTEQPFTRSLGGVTIPPGVSEVTVRAHDKKEGFGGREMKVKIPQQ